MSKEEITDCYGEKHMWTDFNNLEENPIQHCMWNMIFHAWNSEALYRHDDFGNNFGSDAIGEN